jgi:hypothetical protein
MNRSRLMKTTINCRSKHHLREASIDVTSVAIDGKASLLINPVLTKAVDRPPIEGAVPDDASEAR